MQRLEMADDPVRSKFPRTIASITGTLLTSKLRPSFVRVLTQSAPLISKLPLPDSLELLYKLAMQSMWMNTAHVLVAVSPSFADSVALYHPNVKSKLRSCMAGAPEPSSQSSWPLPMRGERLKLVMLGRVSLHKGWDYAAEALKNIESKNPAGAERLEFVTIGGLGDYGGGEYGKRVYKSLRELKKITYVSLGHLPHEDVMEIMSGGGRVIAAVCVRIVRSRNSRGDGERMYGSRFRR